MFNKLPRRLKILITILMLAILALITVLAIRQNLGRKVKLNDVAAVGNTAGNLYNSGLFCQAEDERVYFANPLDGNSLYSMNPDETNFKKLTNAGVNNLLCSGNFVFYYMQSANAEGVTGLGSVVREFGIYRVRNDGKYNVCIARDVLSSMQMGGSYIYYLQGNTMNGLLRRIRIDSTKAEDFYPAYIDPRCYQGGYIYYTDSSSNTLYGLNVEREASTPGQMANVNLFQPIIVGSNIYFMDGVNDYRVCRLNINDGSVTTITPYGVDAWNMNGTYIYYDSQTADVPGLYRCNLDGSNNTLVISGVYNSINLTSDYVYFKQYGGDNLYHMQVGGLNPSAFMPEVISK